MEYGDFGEADPRVQELSGLKNYNIRIKLKFSNEEDENKTPAMIDLGILYDNGNKGSFKGIYFSVSKATLETSIGFNNFCLTRCSWSI